jgi:hypothetical protein
MFSLNLTPLDVFVGPMAVSASFVLLWTVSTIFDRYTLIRISTVLAAIFGLLTAVLYVSLWGFTLV